MEKGLIIMDYVPVVRCLSNLIHMVGDKTALRKEHHGAYMEDKSEGSHRSFATTDPLNMSSTV